MFLPILLLSYYPNILSLSYYYPIFILLSSYYYPIIFLLFSMLYHIELLAIFHDEAMLRTTEKKGPLCHAYACHAGAPQLPARKVPASGLAVGATKK